MEQKIASFFRDSLRIPESIARFSDIRNHPRISLKTILVFLLLMPFWGVTSLLALDRISSKRQVKTVFDFKRKMVASDSTVARVLKWLDGALAAELLRGIGTQLNRRGYLRRKLSAKGHPRRIGILDGSVMGGHSLVTATLLGTIDYPVAVYSCAGRGHELPTAYRILQELPLKLGRSAPELWLCDGLYINQNTFHLVRSSGAHLLVKCGDNPEFRDIFRDAQALFTYPTTAVQPVASASGFDPERFCSWTIQKTSGEFAGYPVTIFFLVEDYPKRKDAPQEETCIVTTDLSLSPEEAREAAHLRWHSENNVFKRLSHVCGTKRFYFKDPRQFFTLLRLFCLAVTIFDAFFLSIRREEELFNCLRAGIKPTWKNLCSQWEELLPPFFGRLLAFGY